MSDLVVLTSNKGQGKRTAALLLEEKFRNDGYSVACLVRLVEPKGVHPRRQKDDHGAAARAPLPRAGPASGEGAMNALPAGLTGKCYAG